MSSHKFSDESFERPNYCISPPLTCLEVAREGGEVALRNSENPDEVVVVSEDEFETFVQSVKDGQFDV